MCVRCVYAVHACCVHAVQMSTNLLEDDPVFCKHVMKLPCIKTPEHHLALRQGHLQGSYSEEENNNAPMALRQGVLSMVQHLAKQYSTKTKKKRMCDSVGTTL